MIQSLRASKNHYVHSRDCYEIPIAALEDTEGKRAKVTTIPKLPLSFINTMGSFTYSNTKMRLLQPYPTPTGVHSTEKQI